MTPKEKAEELVDKFYPMFDNSVRDILSKKCSLIAVDEVIEAINSTKNLTNNLLSQTYETAFINLPSTSFWEDVKKEIENI